MSDPVYYALPRLPYFTEPFVRVGDMVWWRFSEHYAVECRVESVDFYCSPGDDKPGFFAGEDWDLSPETKELLLKCHLASQWISLDEPVGHSVELWREGRGPGFDDVFLTKDAVLSFMPVRKRCRRRAHSALMRWRERQINFINWTHVMACGKGELRMDQYPDKEVYSRLR